MIRNYNGNVNRTLLRDIRRLCEVNADNLKNLLEAFAQNGAVSFYTNTFMGMVDEMSDAHTLTSEAEIREYLKSVAQERFDGYLRNKIADDDYLLTAVLEFIKENGNCTYPSKDEMRQLECTAEVKRVAELPETTTAETPMTEQDVMREIMELAEEIFESRRLTKPEDIFCPVEPCYDRLHVENGDFSGFIEWDSHYGSGDCSDYHVRGQLMNDDNIRRISFYRYHDGTASASGEKWRDERVDVTKEHIITVHKSMVELATQEGIEFMTEIDYEKIA